MRGRLLIVEDEPIVALDLKQELEQLGCEVLGVAESADEALVAAGVHRPDLALMDVRIVGSVDGIQTAGLLRAAYQIPVDQFLKELQKRNGVNEIYEQIAHEKVVRLLQQYAQVEDEAPVAS